MKVLILANFDVGLYKFRKELIENLINRGDEIYISLPDGDLVQPLVDMGCRFIDTPVDRRGINPVKDLKLLTNYKSIVKKISPDIVITYTIKPNIYGGIVSSLFNKKYAINITGLGSAFQNNGIMLRFIIALYKTACKKAHTVIFENEENMQLFLDNGIVKKQQVLLNPGAGVNLDEYKSTEYPSEKNDIHFLFIGRIMQEKGIDELFSAAKRIKAEYDNVQFDIVGMYEDNYENTVSQLSRQGIINFHGYQEDVKPFIQKSSCFVLPSWHEGMANTNLESAAMGRPVITSNIHGCKEAVIENESGFLCEPKNADSLYNQLRKFINLPYEQKVRMGKCARKHMEDVFDKNKVIEATVKRIQG